MTAVIKKCRKCFHAPYDGVTAAPCRNGRYCYVPVTHKITLGEIVSLLQDFEVSGDKIEAVHMISGWTYNIINLSETENLVTVMTCNEVFNPEHPDTFYEPV